MTGTMRLSNSVGCVCAILISTALAFAATDSSPAPTPPMGWNSWDSYGTTVREENVKANADWMAEHLAKYGWKYIVVDIQWYEPNAQGHDYKPGAPLTMDEYGRLIPAVNRFPSSANGAGFKPLADYVHSKGLKFGIHIIRGIPRSAVEQNLPIAHSHYRAAEAADTSDKCEWNSDNYGLKNNKAAQAYYDSLADLYARWGVDFLKVDCISRPWKADEIHMMRQALAQSGRAIAQRVRAGTPAPGRL